MPDIPSAILSLRGWPALAVVFALPALESSAFVGFVFPGEIAVLLGGVLASHHRISLGGAIVAAVSGAVIGDTLGYAIGRRFGNRLLAAAPLQRLVKAHHVNRAKQYLAEKGGRAVFLGRFTAALRVLVPGLAGMSDLRYRRFLAANMAGGALWGAGFALLGYVAGDGWRRVEKTARDASLLLLGIIVVAVVAFGAARWIARNPERVRAVPILGMVHRRLERPLAWLTRRLRPSGALGLSLTLGFFGLMVVGTAFGLVVRAVLGHQTLHTVDEPVLRFLIRHRSPGFTTAMKFMTAFGSAAVLIPAIALVGGGLWLWKRSLRPLVLLGGAFGGAAILDTVIKALVGRHRPPAALHLMAATGSSFPSGHSTQAVAVYGCAAALIAATAHRWDHKVLAWTVAVLLAAMIGFTRLYLGVHWLTDVLGGLALGGLWLGILLILTRMVAEGRSRDRAGDPELVRT